MSWTQGGDGRGQWSCLERCESRHGCGKEAAPAPPINGVCVDFSGAAWASAPHASLTVLVEIPMGLPHTYGAAKELSVPSTPLPHPHTAAARGAPAHSSPFAGGKPPQGVWPRDKRLFGGTLGGCQGIGAPPSDPWGADTDQKWARWSGAYWGNPLRPCPRPCSLKDLGHLRDLSSPEDLEQSIGVPLGVMGIPRCWGSSKDLAIPEHIVP